MVAQRILNSYDIYIILYVQQCDTCTKVYIYIYVVRNLYDHGPALDQTDGRQKVTAVFLHKVLLFLLYIQASYIHAVNITDCSIIIFFLVYCTISSMMQKVEER